MAEEAPDPNFRKIVPEENVDEFVKPPIVRRYSTILQNIFEKTTEVSSFGKINALLLIFVMIFSFLSSWGGLEISKETKVGGGNYLVNREGEPIYIVQMEDLDSFAQLKASYMDVDGFVTDDGLYAKTYASIATDSLVTLFSEAGVMKISSDETSEFTPSADVSTHMMASLKDREESKTLQGGVGKWKIRKKLDRT